MKYPSLDQFIKSNFYFSEGNNIDQSFDMIADCVDKIYNQEEVWSTADVTKKEVVDFLEQLNTMQFKEIEQFFDTMPRLSHEVKIKNPKTKVESTVVLEGLASFFG
jgi:archaellum component FlaC